MPITNPVASPTTAGFSSKSNGCAKLIAATLYATLSIACFHADSRLVLLDGDDAAAAAAYRSHRLGVIGHSSVLLPRSALGTPRDNTKCFLLQFPGQCIRQGPNSKPRQQLPVLL